jgi:co-chaperonin GroES (HSP10)
MKVFGNKVLVKEQKVEKIGDLYIPDSERQEARRGTVVEIGSEVEDKLSIGDSVLYPHYCQTKFTEQGEEYTVLKVDEILVKL